MTFSILAIFCYLISVCVLIPGLVKENIKYQKATRVIATIAIVLHFCALQKEIFSVASGQNLSLLTMGSLVSLLISLIMTIVAFSNRTLILLPVVYSLAIVSVALTQFIPLSIIVHLEKNPVLLLHIVFALFSYAILVIAMFYALQVAWINYQLKHKRLLPTDMPPLMVIERKFFHITQTGVLLLTIALILGFFYSTEIFNRFNGHKMMFALIAWAVYAVLLWGHLKNGWRGMRVIWLSLSGIILLTISYFGSRLVQYFLYYA